MNPNAFIGPVGKFIDIVEPHTEASREALAVTFLLATGNYLFRNSYYEADGARHYGNEFAAIVGDSSKSRKGTSLGRVKEIFRKIDPDYLDSRFLSGMSTGEGVILGGPQ